MEISKLNGSLKVLEKTLSSSVLLLTLPSGKQYIVKRATHSRLRKEYDILSQLSHPNIIKVYDYGYDHINKHYMVSEFCENGDMISFLQRNFAKILNKKNILSLKFEKFWRTVFLSIFEVLVYLSSKNLAHMDIKPENVLITEKFVIKLCDFELIFSTKDSKGISKNCAFIAGTEIYYSPEITENKIPYNAIKSTIFSFGITILNMITGSQILSKDTSDLRYKLLKSSKFNEFWASIKYSRFLSENFKDLMMKMLKFDSDERIGLEEIKGHQWCGEGILSEDEIREFLM